MKMLIYVLLAGYRVLDSHMCPSVFISLITNAQVHGNPFLSSAVPTTRKARHGDM
jgi:hypothetical protein